MSGSQDWGSNSFMSNIQVCDLKDSDLQRCNWNTDVAQNSPLRTNRLGSKIHGEKDHWMKADGDERSILFLALSKEYPELTGGTEIFRFRLAAKLQSRGYKVKLLTVSDSKTVIESYAAVGIGINLRYPPFVRRYALRLLFLIPYSLLTALLSQARSILVWSGYSLLLGFPLCKVSGKKCVVRCAGAEVFSLGKSPQSWKERIFKFNNRVALRLMKLADVVVANSQFMKKALLSYGLDPGKIEVIPNGVDMNIIQERNLESSQPLSLITVGRLTKGMFGDKQQDTLIRAFARFLMAHPNSRLRIVGSGPQREYLSRLASDLGITNQMVMTGKVPAEQVVNYLSDSDIFVFPSAFEGMSNALLEAVLSGVPVVASDIEPNQELLNEVNGSILFSPGSVDGLLKGLEEAANDLPARKRLAGESALKLRKTYSVGGVIDSYTKLLVE
jgi:glycosyltransferase involved in cell wall biosynthesis